ncbi:MAG: BatA domain-containing protein [Verrucomicrobia subdivision 3 bacterium]|nr:BatA domain-containing protein [Limisphaerales bacterium]
MNFLNILLVGGVAAGALPIIVHLISRSKPREVRWGAMHLIELTLQKQQRRLRIENWLLLLLRICIPVFLALCMARPVLTGAAALWSDAKTSLVVVLDNSYSQDFRVTGGTNFENARQQAADLVVGLQRGSDVSVVLMSGTNSPLYDSSVFNTKRVSEDLKMLEAGYGKAEVPSALDVASALSRNMSHAQREIIVISDFQRISWLPEEANLRQRAAERLGATEIAPRLTLFHTGAEGRENVCVETVSFSPRVLGMNQTLQVRATLRNYGNQGHDSLKVVCRVDGKVAHTTQIPLEAGQKRQVLFTHQFDSAGSHVVEVSADADSLKADNTFRVSIPVWERVPVLVVDGDPSAEPLESETDFLQIALQPYREAGAPAKPGEKKLADLLEVRVIRTVGLSAAAIGDARVMVLANVARLTPKQLVEVQNFVRDGGGVLIFPGDQIDVKWYNETLHAAGLLPAPLTELADLSREPEPFTRIRAQRFEHAPLNLFNDPRNGTPADAEITKWYRTLAQPDNPLVRMHAMLESGDPFLLEKRFNEGRVFFCATSCDEAWNNLPGRPFYVPFAQRLCTYLASSLFPPRNLGVGSSAVAFFPPEEIGQTVTMRDTQSKITELTIESRGNKGVAEFSGTGRPGLYTMTGPDKKPIHFVVNTSRVESNLQQLEADERQQVADELKADLVSSVEDYRALDHTRRFGQEIWKPLFILVLILLFGELLLQRRMARQRN